MTDTLMLHIHSVLMFSARAGTRPLGDLTFVLPIPQCSPTQSAAQEIKTDPVCDALVMSTDHENQFALWQMTGIRTPTLRLEVEYGITLETTDLDLDGIDMVVAGRHPQHDIYVLSDDVKIPAATGLRPGSSLGEALAVAWEYACTNKRPGDNCGHYATRTAAFLSDLGLSTRFAYGTMGIPPKGIRLFRSDDERTYPTVGLTGSDACPHTWAEVFVSGHGWLGVPGSYYPLSLTCAHKPLQRGYGVRLLPGHMLGPVYDSGCVLAASLPASELQTEFTTIYSPTGAHTDLAAAGAPAHCPACRGHGMDCLGKQNEIDCCLRCHFRSIGCLFSRKYEYWQRVCQNCPRVFSEAARCSLAADMKALVSRLAASDERQDVVERLRRRGPEAVPYLIEATANTNLSMRLWAAYALSKMDSTTVRRALERSDDILSPWHDTDLSGLLSSSPERVPSLANMKALEGLIERSVGEQATVHPARVDVTDSSPTKTTPSSAEPSALPLAGLPIGAGLGSAIPPSVDDRGFEEAIANEVEVLVGAGIGAVEVAVGFALSAHRAEIVRDRVSEAGLLLWSIHVNWQSDWRDSNLDHAEHRLARYLAHVEHLGSPVVIYHPSHWAARDEDANLLDARSRECALLKRHVPPGVRLAFENCDTRLGLQYCLALADDLGESNVGLCIDVGHANIGLGAVEALRMAGDKVLSLHLHDNDGKRDEHLPPGEGTIDWTSVCHELVRIGYTGPLMLECKYSDGAHLAAIAQYLRRIEH